MSSPSEQSGDMRMTKSLVLASAALAGFLSLAVELSLSRLLRPWFGDMLFVWAGIIGFVLLYLAVGNLLGGRWSAHGKNKRLPWVFLVAGVGIFAVPLISRPLLVMAQVGMRSYYIAVPAAALAVIFLLLAVPLTLLGTVSPLAVGILTRSAQQEGGRIAGWVFGLSTAASLVGAFLPVFVLLPILGTRATFALLGLLAVGWAGVLWSTSGYWAKGVGLFLLLLVGIWGTLLIAHTPIKGMPPGERGKVLYEEESAYSFIQVIEWKGERWLRLNEGEGIHSVWRPGPGLSEGIWDYFLLAPYFTSYPRESTAQSLLVIGLAGGTVPTLYSRAFGPMRMVGVELDPAIIDVAYRYFGLSDLPFLETVATDGRLYLTLTDEKFDVIAVDAYRPPYIPFHLTTIEFFRQTRSHLSPNGVVAVNAAHTRDDFSLVYVLSSTMQQVFPSVLIIDEPMGNAAWGNSLVVGTNQTVQEDDFWQNIADDDNPYIQEMARRARGHVRVAPPPDTVFWDDRAPVESVVHGIMLRYLLGKE